MTALLRFRADGRLDVIVPDSFDAFATLPIRPAVSAGAVTCEIGNRWRAVDGDPLPMVFTIGILFTCDDGLAREAVFRVPDGAASSPPPNGGDDVAYFGVVLLSVAGKPAGDAKAVPGRWAPFRFTLLRATE
jgi:hypothetical protein